MIDILYYMSVSIGYKLYFIYKSFMGTIDETK